MANFNKYLKSPPFLPHRIFNYHEKFVYKFMTISKIILILFTLFLSFDGNGQSITWQRMYDTGHPDDNGHEICEDGKGNFFVVGGFSTNLYVMKINAYGIKLWEKMDIAQIDRGKAITPSGDGGCVITGDNDSAYTIKLDSSGNIVWWKNYIYGSIRSYDIDRTSDGGYILCGEMINAYRDGIAYKIDSLGNLKWFKIYPAAFSTELFDILEMPDKGYIINGIYDSSYISLTSSYIIKTDTLGNIIWEKTYQINNQRTFSRSINIFQNKFIISGWTGTSARPYFMRTDLNGNINYIKIFDDIHSTVFPVLKIIIPNKYVLAYSLESGPLSFSNGKLIITDSLGTILHQKLLPSGGYMYLENVTNLDNGDIISIGSNEYDSTSNRDIYIVRTDSLLNTPPIGIKYSNNNIPVLAELEQNYPNPFNSITKFNVRVNKNSIINLSIYDIRGRFVEKLFSGDKSPGKYIIKWDASKVASGIYFCILKVNNTLSVGKKIVLIK